MPPNRQASRPVRDLLTGTPYRTVARLGAGGMGVVLEAEERETGRRVAVKLLHDELTHDRESLERFRTEAEIAGLLNHPHIVEVTELRMPPAVERPYFVMEVLRGETVVDRLHRRGALPVDEAVDITIQTLRGLAAAHATGIVHRDVKPGNIFLCTNTGKTVVKLLDFGIAKLLPFDGKGRKLTPHTFKTREGTFLGTALYASPEQARGPHVDQRTDVYAVGNVLYNLLTGRTPFPDVKGTHEILAAQEKKMPPPPSSLAASPVPAELDDLVMAALAKSPEDRLQSAEHFIEALEDIAARFRAPTGWLRTAVFDPERKVHERPAESAPEGRQHRRPRADKAKPAVSSAASAPRPAVFVVVAFAVGTAVSVLVLLAWRLLQ